MSELKRLIQWIDSDAEIWGDFSVPIFNPKTNIVCANEFGTLVTVPIALTSNPTLTMTSRL